MSDLTVAAARPARARAAASPGPGRSPATTSAAATARAASTTSPQACFVEAMSGELEAVGFRTERRLRRARRARRALGRQPLRSSTRCSARRTGRASRAASCSSKTSTSIRTGSSATCCSCSRPACSTRRRRSCSAPSRPGRSRRTTAATRCATAIARVRAATRTPILTGLPFGHVPTKVMPAGRRPGAPAGRRARTRSSAGSIPASMNPRFLARVAQGPSPCWRAALVARAPATTARIPKARRPPTRCSTPSTSARRATSIRRRRTANRIGLHLPDLRAALRLPLPEAALRAGRRKAAAEVAKPYYLDKDGQRAARRRAGRADRRERLRRPDQARHPVRAASGVRQERRRASTSITT